MSSGGVHIEGLRETTRAMEKAGVDVEDLKEVMGRIATEASDTMQGFMPHRSGALRASTRGNRAKGKAIVMVGKARVPYAGPIAYGWKARGIRPGTFIQRTDRVMETRAPALLEEGWQLITEKYGL